MCPFLTGHTLEAEGSHRGFDFTVEEQKSNPASPASRLRRVPCSRPQWPGRGLRGLSPASVHSHAGVTARGQPERRGLGDIHTLFERGEVPNYELLSLFVFSGF